VNPHEAILHSPTSALGMSLRRGDNVEDLYPVRRTEPFDGPARF
jgi:hypothetical protein